MNDPEPLAGTWNGITSRLTSVVCGDGDPLLRSEDTNIVCEVRVPGWGTSTPAIRGDHLGMTAAEDDGRNLLICFDRAGMERRKVTLGKAPVARNRKASAANPSPVTDGGHLYCTREDGTIFVVRLTGEPEVVSENAQRENTYATPAFADGRVDPRTSD